MNNDKTKTVGILGGMSPYATAMFFKNILDLTPAKEYCDHFRIIVDSNPHIPSCSRAILHGGESPVKDMIESCQNLSSYPVDFIVIPSNNAAYFLSDVRKSVKTPILDIVRTTSEALNNKYNGLKKVAVLGDEVTFLKQIYKTSLEKKGIQSYEYDKYVYGMVLDLIEELKLGNQSDLTKRHFNKIVHNLKNSGVEGIILACAELTVFRDNNLELPLVDSSHALAHEVVQIALGKRAIILDIENVYEFWKKRSKMLAAGEVSDYQSTLLQ